MTINSQTRKAGPYSGDGITVALPFAFKVFTAADIYVVQVDATGAETVKALTTDYTVSLNPDQNANPGGTVTMLVAPLPGYQTTLTSMLPYLQQTDLTNQGGFYPKVITDVFDRITIFVQQLASAQTAMLQFPVGDPTANANGALPTRQKRAGMLLSFDANGNPVLVAAAAQSATALSQSLAASGGASLIGNTPAGNITSTTVQAALNELDTHIAAKKNSNPIINRDMEICQNPASVAAAVDGTIVPDHWIYNKIGSMVHTVSQDTDVPTLAQAGRLLQHSYRVNLTVAQATIGTGDELVIVQKLEGVRFRNIAQTAQKIRFWVKATLPGQYSVSLRNDVPDQSCILPFTINAANTWELKLLDMPATPSAGTWVYGNSGAGLRVGIVLAAGSIFQAPSSGAWVSGYFHSVAGNINGVQSGATDFRFTDFDIYPATGLANTPRDFEDEERLCKRIRRRFTGLPVGAKILHGVVTSPTTADFSFEGDMRTVNAVNFSGTLNLLDGVASYAITGMAFVASKDGVTYFTVTCSGGMTAGRAAEIRMGSTTDYVEFSGEF